jgi:phosphatidate phosphatase LPIN
MNYVQNVFDGFHYYLFDLNAATLSGAIDVVAIPQEGGELRCTPFHVRFGKIQLLRSTEKTVSLFVNDVETPVLMKLGRQGEAYFVEEVEGPPATGEYLASPINSPPPSPRRDRPSSGTMGFSCSSALCLHASCIAHVPECCLISRTFDPHSE